MQQIDLSEEEAKIAFVKRAIKYFEENTHTYSYGDIENDSLFCLRWGMDNDCLVVFNIDEDTPIVNYTNVLDKEKSMRMANTIKLEKTFKYTLPLRQRLMDAAWSIYKETYSVRNAQSHDDKCACERCVFDKISAHLKDASVKLY